MDALASSLKRLLFPKARKQPVNSGITQKHWAEMVAFGFLDYKRLCRIILDVCLIQIPSFPPKKGVEMHKAQHVVYFLADTG